MAGINAAYAVIVIHNYRALVRHAVEPGRGVRSHESVRTGLFPADHFRESLFNSRGLFRRGR